MVWDPEGGKVLWWVLFLDQTTLCLLHILPRPGWQEWFTNKLRGSLHYLRLTSNNVLLNGLAWKSQCVSIALQEVSAWNKSGDISKDWSPWNQLVVHPASNHFLTKFALLDLISTKLTLTATPEWLTYWDANVPNGFDQPQRGNLRKITNLKLALFLFQRSAKWTPPSPIHFPKNSGFRTFLRDLAGSIWVPAKKEKLPLETKHPNETSARRRPTPVPALPKRVIWLCVWAGPQHQTPQHATCNHKKPKQLVWGSNLRLPQVREKGQKVLLLDCAVARQGPPCGQAFVESAAHPWLLDCYKDWIEFRNQITHQCFLGTHQILAHRRVNDLATFFVGLSASLLVTVPVIDLARQVLTSWQIKTITLKNICHHAELLLASFRKVVLACSEGAAETTSLETWQIRVIPWNASIVVYSGTNIWTMLTQEMFHWAMGAAFRMCWQWSGPSATWALVCQPSSESYPCSQVP